MYEIGRIYEFESAHFLPKYEGKCKRMHGHNYKVMLKLRSEILQPPFGICSVMDAKPIQNSQMNMVLDFHLIDEIVKPILDQLDHQILNEVGIKYPTAERIAQYIYTELKYNKDSSKTLPYLHSVQIWENEWSYAEYSGA